MSIKKIIISTLTFLLTVPAYALMCPTNFNTINPGDSIEQVKRQCGAPNSEKETDLSDNVPQEWSYYVVLSPNNPAKIKTTVTFIDGKVTNMSVNGMSIGKSSICGGRSVRIGDSEEKVKSACGEPEFINKGTDADKKPVNKKTVLTYTSSASTVTLTFINGIFRPGQ